MSRLFWKIFFSFWLVMLLLLVTNLSVTWIQAALFEAEEQNEHVAALADRALTVYSKKGPDGYRKWRKDLHHKTGLKVLLLDANNQEVSGVRIPQHVAALLSGRFDEYRKKYDSPPERFKFEKRFYRPVSWQVSDGQNQRYTFVVTNPRELSDHLFATTSLIWRIVISTLVVTIISLLLSLYLVKPIRQLQATSRKLASGDLSVRVPKKLNQRKDELGELSQDFDAMAEKIEALMTGQQNMLRDVSHELRTPLARLRVALELARKRSGESSELDRMELEAERINELIDEILQFVRLNSAQQGLHKESVFLSSFLNELAETTQLSEQRIRIDCPKNSQLQADRKLLTRAIDNIVQNALKYSEGPVDIVVQDYAQESNGKLCMTIRDHGPGVETDQLEALFKPFYRTDDARGRSTGGYGLGLAIAAQAVKAHNGAIFAKNHPEGGLEVTLQFNQ